MSKHSLLDPKMLELFDFAAANPMQGPLMTTQLMMPAVMLQMLEIHEQDMHRLDQMLAGDAEKTLYSQHEEKTSAQLEGKESEEGMGQDTDSTSFNLIYYNPETNEAQVLKEEVTTTISEYVVKEKKSKVGTEPAPPRAVDYMQQNQTAAVAQQAQAAAQQSTAQGQKAPDSHSVSSPQTQFEINSPEYLSAKTAMSIDQAVGQKSTYPIYTNVATPLAMQMVDPIRLEIALKKIEIQSPKPFGGAAGVVVAPIVFDKVEEQIKHEGIEAEIVAIDRLHKEGITPGGEHPEITALHTLREMEAMRAETLHQLDVQIKAFEHVIEELEVTDKSMKRLLNLLPPLSRARYLALLAHDKKIAETLVVDLLIADLEFIIIVKEAIKKNGLRGLLDTLKKLGRLPAPVIQKSGGGDDDDEEDVKIIPIKKGSGKPSINSLPKKKDAKGKGKDTGNMGKDIGENKGKAEVKPKKKEGVLGRAIRKLTKKK